jgi:hypothetical protein
VLAQHLGMVAGDDDQRALVLAARLEVVDDAADMVVHFRYEPVVGRAHLAYFQFVRADWIKRAVFVVAPGLAEPVQFVGEHRVLALFLLQRSRTRGKLDVGRMHHGVVGFRCDQGWMRPQEHEMGEPWAVAPYRQPFQECVGQEGRLAVLGRIDRRNIAEPAIGRFFESRPGPEHIGPSTRQVVAFGEEVRDPLLHLVGQVQRRLETPHDAFIGRQRWVAGIEFARIGAGVGVTEQGRPVAGLANFQRHIGMVRVERRAVATRAVVHQVEAREQART